MKNLIKMKKFIYALSVLVCMLGVSENVWACSNNQDKAVLTAVCLDSESGKGRVYTSTSATPPTNVSSYAANNANGSKQQEDAIEDFPLYAHAKAVRGYEFDHWEDATESGWVNNRTLPEDMTTNPICVLMDGNEGCYGVDPSIAVVNAFFHEITPFSLRYKAGQYVYKIDYTYVAITENDALENKVWESYTILNTSSTQTLKTYVGDKVSLSTSITDGFAGWFVEGQESAVSTANPYIFSPTEADADKVFYPQWNALEGNVASVNGTEYATIQEAVSVANTSVAADVSLSLLQNVLYNESDYLDLGRDMTIDLNGKIFYGMKGSTFRVTNNATITIKDGASTKGKVWGIAASQGESQAIDVLQGTLINNGAVITMDNMLGETDYTVNTLSSVIRVHKDGAYTQTTGTLNCNSISNAYGVYSEGTTAINGGTINTTASLTNACAIFATDGTTNITAGTIKAQAKYKACGVYADGNAGGTAANITIAGGTFTSTATSRDAVGVRTADGTTTINGGTFTVTYSNTLYNAYGVVAGLPSVKDREGYPNNGKLIVNDGTFNMGTASKTYYSYGIFIEPSIANTSYGDQGYVATTINGGKFKMIGKTVGGAVNEIAESLQIKGGYFSSNTRLDLNIPATHHSEALSSGTEYNAGYRYQVVTGAPAIPDAVCKIGETTFNTLEDAISYANNNPEDEMTILMLKDYLLSQPGKYTIPAKTTLLIPKDANQTSPMPEIYRENKNDIPTKAYITLTMGKDVMLDVKGAIEVGGQQNNYNTTGTGRPNGSSYGWLLMKTGSHILLEGNSNLYAWGFITGNGTIDVRRGANVHEQFQVYDFEGGSESFYTLYDNEYDVFLVNEYFVQNVEVPTTYRPGSALYGYTGLKEVNVRAKLIGVDTDDAAMFLMDETDDSEDTWVRKSYDVSTDQQVYEVNNSARLGNLHLSFSNYDFNSEDYVLPITNNMKIHLLEGEMGITQSTVLLPGAEIEIDKKSTASIVADKSLFLFDYHEWDAHISTGAKYALRIECRPGALPTASIRDISSSVGLGNAKLNIHGTFDAKGALYTTASGATIVSTNDDAGNVTFSTTAPSGPETPLYVHKYSGMFYQRPTVPALLQNADGTFEQSASTPAGKSFCYMNDKWILLTVDPDSSCFVYDQYDQYYAQAGEYVAISASKDSSTKRITGNPDHTYSDAAGAGRLFILAEGCQWWEVENIDNLYHCIHPQNDTYYYWVSDIDEETGIDNGTWAEKKFAISWKNWDGSDLYDGNHDVIIPDMLPYGATPQYLHTPNPERAADIDYTYTFDDWNPALSPVTKDQTYTATYIKEDRKYVIIFKDAENVEVKREFLKHNEMPTPPDLTNEDKILLWSPAISAVTGSATYTATWLDVEPTEYAITFYDYDGTTILKPTGEEPYMVAVEEVPIAPSNPANKPATNEFTYEFDHWSPEIEEVSLTSVKSYTAVYREIEKTYPVRFFNEGTTNTTKSDENALSKQNLTYGATPTPPAVSKSATGHTYIPEWVDMSSLTFDGEGNITTDEEDWVKSVRTVTKAADYVVVYRDEINRYTVSASSSIAAGCVISGAGTYDYGTEVELTVTPNPGYRFLRWNDNNTDNPRRFTLESNVSLTAVVEQYISDVVMNENDQVTYSKPNTPIHNLYISSDGTNSSYLNGAENLVLSEVDAVQGQAYFDLTLNTWSRHWNAFAVPFEVDLKNTSIVEVKTKGGVATNRTLRYGRDYDIVYYKESVRATSGPSYNCWDYVDSKNKVLTPGEAYLIAFTSHVGTIRFTGEQDGEHHIKLGTSVEVSYTDPADPKDGGWNGIGNPRTYHALLDAGVTECQIHNGDTIGSDSYMPYVMSDKKFVVGKAAFVKVGAAPSVVVERATNQSAITPKAAPRRAKTITTGGDRYTVEIMPENGKIADRLFLLIDEDKPDEYTDGKDLPKAGVGSARAQMWVSRYGAKLCKNTIAPTDDQADYPLGIYAPKAGEYIIYIAAQPEEEQALYLTKDGKAIWNLSDGAYTLNLERGTTTQYGLRVSAKGPQVATGVDEAIVDAHGNTQKVLINNQVYIIRGDKVYSIDGQLVK